MWLVSGEALFLTGEHLDASRMSTERGHIGNAEAQAQSETLVAAPGMSTTGRLFLREKDR